MGTRYLTVVTANKKPVIAQYGHYDGHPNDSGKKILITLQRDQTQHIQTQLQRCITVDEHEYRSYFRDGFLEEEMLEKAHPLFWWYDGADLLNVLLDEERKVELRNHYSFAYDSIQCEWGYVIDYDTQVFEIFKGWNKKPIAPDERFYGELSETGYYPIRLVARYPLSYLPSVSEFIHTEWERFEDMRVKVISVTTLNGVDQSEIRSLYENIEGFVGYIPKIIIGERMYLMRPNKSRPRIHTTCVRAHTTEGNIHVVRTLNSIYTFEELGSEDDTQAT